MGKQIYLDYAATTFVRQEVIDAMLPYMNSVYGNPSSIHSFGLEATKAVNKARASIAGVFSSAPEEIYFTSGGSESDNLAVRGIAFANSSKGKSIITSKIEHPAVMNACENLEK